MKDSTERSDSTLPLDGIKVLDLAQLVAAPSAALLLADYGADVVKVEPPTGDAARVMGSSSDRQPGQSPMFDVYNRNKTVVQLDLRSATGLAEVWRLIAQSDVVITAARPGSMTRLGLDADQILARHPSIVYASVSGFGSLAKPDNRPGVDLVIQAESGIMSTTGEAGGQPTKVGFTIVDAATGHALTHGILAALLRRERTGRGGVVATSLHGVAVHLQSGPLAEYVLTGYQPPRSGNSAPMSAPADVFQCRDDLLLVSAYTDKHWSLLAAELDRSELIEDERFATIAARISNRTALIHELELSFKTDGVESWRRRLTTAGIVAGAIKDYAAVIDDCHELLPDTVQVNDGWLAMRNPVELEASMPPSAARPRMTDPTETWTE